MLVIHGIYMATRVIVSFLEAGLVAGKDFRLAPFTDRAAIKSPEWLENQPFGQMPYVVDEETGAVLFESRAIARYALLKHGKTGTLSPLPSGDLEAYTKFEIGVNVEMANFDPSAGVLFVEHILKPMRNLEFDPAAAAKAEETIKMKLEGYERILSKQAWIGGNEMTLADLFHLPYGDAITRAGAVKPLTDGSLLHVAAWWKKLTELESWKKVARGKAEDFA